MPTPSQGTIGSLDYPSDERKKLAKKSVHFTCPDCGGEGPVADLLKCKSESVDESDNSLAQEAKEIIKTMSLKVNHDSVWLMQHLNLAINSRARVKRKLQQPLRRQQRKVKTTNTNVLVSFTQHECKIWYVNGWISLHMIKILPKRPQIQAVAEPQKASQHQPIKVRGLPKAQLGLLPHRLAVNGGRLSKETECKSKMPLCCQSQEIMLMTLSLQSLLWWLLYFCTAG